MVQYLNGLWVTESECLLSVFDITILRGFGVFDFLRTFQRKPFLALEHVNRFLASIKEVGLFISKNSDQLLQLIEEGISKNLQFDDLYIKLILTGGVSDDGMTPSPERSSLVLLFSKAGTFSDEHFLNGIKLMTLCYERFLPQVKSLNYMSAVVALQNAKNAGAQELLYFSKDGFLLEGGTVNFFGILDGVIYTANECILFGITRAFLLKIANDLGIDVVLRPLHRTQLPELQEAFITSTTREVMPVTNIDGVLIGNGFVGPITKRLMQAFSNARNALLNN